uniref:Uncharacterized protein n=1 Tax=Cacopsylla melanoneura TaxID=428564 RepID=A0A8D8Z5S6_9HEMI
MLPTVIFRMSCVVLNSNPPPVTWGLSSVENPNLCNFQRPFSMEKLEESDVILKQGTSSYHNQLGITFSPKSVLVRSSSPSEGTDIQRYLIHSIGCLLGTPVIVKATTSIDHLVQ